MDPYARADLFLSFTNDGVEVEEGYVTFLTLPWQTQAKAGKFKVQFGKVNTLHLHVLPWVDEPLPITDILLQPQFETWAAEGISVSKVIELPGDTFSEAYFQVLDGTSGDGLFIAPAKGDLTYDGQYRIFRDFGDDHNLEASFSYAYGHNGTSRDQHDEPPERRARLPLEAAPGPALPLLHPAQRVLLEPARAARRHSRRRRASSSAATGSSARRWFTGARYEFSDRADRRGAARQGRGGDADVHAERVLGAPRRVPPPRLRPGHQGQRRRSCRSSSRSAPTAPIRFEG